MKPVKKYIYFVDPGHGWIGVPAKELYELGIIGEISRFSYFNPTTQMVYLEEDCDASRFIAAAKKAGWELEITEKYYNSRSRVPFINYGSFSSTEWLANLSN